MTAGLFGDPARDRIIRVKFQFGDFETELVAPVGRIYSVEENEPANADAKGPATKAPAPRQSRRAAPPKSSGLGESILEASQTARTSRCSAARNFVVAATITSTV